jgi:hypothetical protein
MKRKAYEEFRKMQLLTWGRAMFGLIATLMSALCGCFLWFAYQNWQEKDRSGMYLSLAIAIYALITGYVMLTNLSFFIPNPVTRLGYR